MGKNNLFIAPSFLFLPFFIFDSINEIRHFQSGQLAGGRSTRGRPGIGGRRVPHTQPEQLPGSLSFPVDGDALLGGMQQGNGARPGTFFDTAAAIPALFRIENDGGLTLGRIRHHDVIRANIDAKIAPFADGGVKLDHPVG